LATYQFVNVDAPDRQAGNRKWADDWFEQARRKGSLDVDLFSWHPLILRLLGEKLVEWSESRQHLVTPSADGNSSS